MVFPVIGDVPSIHKGMNGKMDLVFVNFQSHSSKEAKSFLDSSYPPVGYIF